MSGKIDGGWEVYWSDVGWGGGMWGSLKVEKIEGVELVGKVSGEGKEIEKLEKVFEMKLG